ncbi:hypothetical protein JHW43_008873 [Diplocarpon mali]|nr:hypothetical protein JHW43_008873 [Diplocarpon mali]
METKTGAKLERNWSRGGNYLGDLANGFAISCSGTFYRCVARVNADADDVGWGEHMYRDLLWCLYKKNLIPVTETSNPQLTRSLRITSPCPATSASRIPSPPTPNSPGRHASHLSHIPPPQWKHPGAPRGPPALAPRPSRTSICSAPSFSRKRNADSTRTRAGPASAQADRRRTSASPGLPHVHKRAMRMPSERSNRDALGPGPPPPGVAERRATAGEACTSAQRDARGHGVAPHQYEGSQRWHGSTPRGLLSRCLEDGGGFWMAGNSGMSPIASM